MRLSPNDYRRIGIKGIMSDIRFYKRKRKEETIRHYSP